MGVVYLVVSVVGGFSGKVKWGVGGVRLCVKVVESGIRDLGFGGGFFLDFGV